jgi:hypothetical protein
MDKQSRIKALQAELIQLQGIAPPAPEPAPAPEDENWSVFDELYEWQKTPAGRANERARLLAEDTERMRREAQKEREARETGEREAQRQAERLVEAERTAAQERARISTPRVYDVAAISTVYDRQLAAIDEEIAKLRGNGSSV